jgi:diadenosine tetraphosphate (Ap4A) HIT family hydrolase
MDCIFCKIIKGEFDSAKIWEDEEFLAILEIRPNTKGMTLVLPKKHFDSYIFDLPDDVYEKLLMAAKKVGKILDKSLKVKKVAMVMEGMGVNHAHIKLYPMYGLDEDFKEMWAKEQAFFDKYPGYITTILGPEAKMEDLKRLADEIKQKAEI